MQLSHVLCLKSLNCGRLEPQEPQVGLLQTRGIKLFLWTLAMRRGKHIKLSLAKSSVPTTLSPMQSTRSPKPQIKNCRACLTEMPGMMQEDACNYEFLGGVSFGFKASERVLFTCRRQGDQVLSSKTVTYRPACAIGL